MPSSEPVTHGGRVEPSPSIRVRRMQLPFGSDLPKHWFHGSAGATHFVNGINLLFPAGERFFVRSVRHYLPRIDDERLRAEAKAFAAQEGHHAREHERFFEVLEHQGYTIRPYLRRYERIAFERIERVAPPALRLAVTAACEHFTAILAEGALDRGLLDGAHPTVRALLLWHASEEIEHKAVAFDVLQRVHPSYALRVAGLAVATACLGGFWLSATRMLLAQDGLSPRAVRRELRKVARERPIVRRVFARGIREYLRRDFHPWQNDNLALARGYLDSIGRAEA